MIREFRLADFFTLGNAACGAAAVFCTMVFVSERSPGYLHGAASLMLAALVLDVLDGRIARWRKAHSAIGLELDSLADIISFGVAPATLGFSAGLNGGWDCVALIYFVCCGVSRLARFNVTAEKLSEGGEKVTHFEGTPNPTSIVLVGILAFAAWQGRLDERLYGGVWSLGPWALHPMALLFVLSGTLMISRTLRTPKL